jgi:hypothetical protein
MSRPVALFAAAVLTAGTVVAVVATGAHPVVGAIMLFGAAVSVAGSALGRSSVVVSGIVAMVVGYGVAVAADSADALASLATGVLLWLHFELSVRSMELRRRVVPTRSAGINWVAGTVGTAALVLALWLLVGVVEATAPDGGVVFRVLAVAAVVVVAVIVSGISLVGRREPPVR